MRNSEETNYEHTSLSLFSRVVFFPSSFSTAVNVILEAFPVTVYDVLSLRWCAHTSGFVSALHFRVDENDIAFRIEE